MAKGMNKRGRDEKKPKKEKPKAAIVVSVASTKNQVVINGAKPKS